MSPITRGELAQRLRVTFYGNEIEDLERQAQAGLLAHPQDPVSLAYLARALFKEGRFAQAEKTLKQLGDAGVVGLIAHGDYNDYVGNRRAAISAYERAIEQEPDNLDALLGLAAVCATGNDVGAADRLAGHAATLIGKEDDCQLARLRVLQGAVAGLRAAKGGLFDKLRWGPGVLHAFHQARDLCPRSPYPAYAMGRFYRDAPGALGGSWSNAMMHFRTAVALDPWYFPARLALIDALAHNGQVAEAELLRVDFSKRFGGLPDALAALTALRA
jgi:tetratricopeptide (TPR) repeat protein